MEITPETTFSLQIATHSPCPSRGPGQMAAAQPPCPLGQGRWGQKQAGRPYPQCIKRRLGKWSRHPWRAGDDVEVGLWVLPSLAFITGGVEERAPSPEHAARTALGQEGRAVSGSGELGTYPILPEQPPRAETHYALATPSG